MWGKQFFDIQIVYLDYYIEFQLLLKGFGEVECMYLDFFGFNGKRSFIVLLRFYIFFFIYLKFRLFIYFVDQMVDS